MPRPLAAVMVSDPTPLTLHNLRRLSRWCDLILTEASRSHQGQPRTPLKARWRELLALEPPRLRVFCTDLPQAFRPAQLEAMQRNGVLPVLLHESDERAVLLLDSDELIDAEATLGLIDLGLDGPKALPLVPLYGALDRVAQSIHCCWQAKRDVLRHKPPEKPYVFSGPTLATVAMIREQSPVNLRHRSPLANQDRSYGLHITMVDDIEQVARKLCTVRHRWDPRILDARHLHTMLSAGVHHAGWWIASYREPEPWLRELAQDCDLRLAGPALPQPHLRALRAWAEARLDPALPERLVRCGDAYAAHRPVEASDDLIKLDELQCQRPMRYLGHVEKPISTLDGSLSDSMEAKVRAAT